MLHVYCSLKEQPAGLKRIVVSLLSRVQGLYRVSASELRFWDVESMIVPGKSGGPPKTQNTQLPPRSRALPYVGDEKR